MNFCLKELYLQRRGMALFVAIFLLVVIFITATYFSKASREARFSSFRFFTAEIARQLAESAVEEAFAVVNLETENQKKRMFQMFINTANNRSEALNCTSGPLNDKSNSGLVIETPQTLKLAYEQDWSDKFTIEVTARIIDFRNVDHQERPFHGAEGVGTLELKAVVTPKVNFANSIPGKFAITRHHGFRICSIISKRSAREKNYVHNRLLDYVLFIKNGRREFQSTGGSNLNPQLNRLTIDQTHLQNLGKGFGKVYLGGTSGFGAQEVFIDVATETAFLLPAPEKRMKISPPSPVSDQDCHKLLPGLAIEVNKSQKEAFEIENKKNKWGAKYLSSRLSGITANFHYQRFPVSFVDIPGVDKELLAEVNGLKNRLWEKATGVSVPEFIDRPHFPVRILPHENLQDIIQGKVRKRYLHYGFFDVDFSLSSLQVKYSHPDAGKQTETKEYQDFRQDVEPFNGSRFPCLGEVFAKDFSMIDFVFLNQNFKTPETISALVTDFDYLPGMVKDSLPDPEFYDREKGAKIDSGDLTNYLPFSHVNLWFRNGGFSQKSLEKFKILFDGELHLRGVVRVSGRVVLKGKNGGPLKVFGQGVLLADEIVIESGIAKSEPETVCVLATRGYMRNEKFSKGIFINTDEKIEAALVALGLNGGGAVYVRNNSLNLYGAMIVDNLEINTWKQNVEHRIEYDPIFCGDEDQYQINVSKWVSYIRITESDEE